jgi:zinc transport system ATP-binding protein
MGPIAPLVSRTVVMRDGRVAYDGEPLTAFHEAQHHHGHHHPLIESEQVHDFTPGVRSPMDGGGAR